MVWGSASRLGWVLLGLAVSLAQADEIPRDEYLRYVPLSYPKLVRQTEASKKLGLFGDPQARGYADVSPKDGIDDRRGKLLMALASRFSPILVRNTTAVPMDFETLMREQDRFRLFIDEWSIAGSPATLARASSIELAGVSSHPCPSDRNVEVADCQLQSLIGYFDPFDPKPANGSRESSHSVPAEENRFKVLYFDFEGTGPDSWNRIYKNVLTREMPRRTQGLEMLYVHPLIYQPKPEVEEYELYLQYWFFYPWDDSGNKHEGDWEHMNVSVTPLSKVGKPLTAQDIQDMLSRDSNDLGSTNATRDPIVIRSVDYYLHQFVMTLDYTFPNVYVSDAEWEKELASLKPERVGQKETWNQIRSTLSTHPTGYIGGDSKGLDLILNSPGAKNRDSHATYPFPGIYKGIGPAEASEEVGTGKIDPSRVVQFDDPSRLTILPDWERVLPLIKKDAAVRERWAWMVLPIRWGYPAVASPFAGIISHAETGNLSPVGPTFSTGWNRPGVSRSFSAFDPQRFSGVLPLGPLDSLQNNFGFLNAPLVLLTTLPPFDLIFASTSASSRVITGKKRPIFYPTEHIPFRYLGVGFGISVQSLDDQVWPALLANAKQLQEVETKVGFRPIDANVVNSFANDAAGPVVQISLDLGQRITTTNSLRHSRSDLALDLVPQGQTQVTSIRGDLNFWEYQGSLRYNLLTDGLMPYLKGGFGLSWYRVENGALNGQPLTASDSDWVRQPSVFPFHNLWPNTLHVGFGMEWVMVKSIDPLLRGTDFGFKLDFTQSWHSLAPGSFFDLGAIESLPTVSRFGASLLVVLSF